MLGTENPQDDSSARVPRAISGPLAVSLHSLEPTDGRSPSRRRRHADHRGTDGRTCEGRSPVRVPVRRRRTPEPLALGHEARSRVTKHVGSGPRRRVEFERCVFPDLVTPVRHANTSPCGRGEHRRVGVGRHVRLKVSLEACSSRTQRDGARKLHRHEVMRSIKPNRLGSCEPLPSYYGIVCVVVATPLGNDVTL
jgi:hypothetical protein